MKTDTKVIPDNIEGKLMDIEKCVIEHSVQAAINTFNRACKRLSEPNCWHNMPGFKGATFTLHKNNKAFANLKEVELDDYISIDIPGPGPKSGDGKDWIQVEYLQHNFDSEADESCCMRVRASANPNKDNQDIISHFFKDMATSTFIIKRNDNKVTASYHGRNEIPNIKHNGLQDSLRNAVVSLVAMALLSEIEWTMFINGLLRRE